MKKLLSSAELQFFSRSRSQLHDFLVHQLEAETSQKGWSYHCRSKMLDELPLEVVARIGELGRWGPETFLALSQVSKKYHDTCLSQGRRYLMLEELQDLRLRLKDDGSVVTSCMDIANEGKDAVRGCLHACMLAGVRKRKCVSVYISMCVCERKQSQLLSFLLMPGRC